MTRMVGERPLSNTVEMGKARGRVPNSSRSAWVSELGCAWA